jgi:hypothetical protein
LGVASLPQTTHLTIGNARSVESDRFASSRISGDITGSETTGDLRFIRTFYYVTLTGNVRVLTKGSGRVSEVQNGSHIER